MYRLAAKCSAKDESKKRKREFFFTQRRPRVYWFIVHYLLLRTELIEIDVVDFGRHA